MRCKIRFNMFGVSITHSVPAIFRKRTISWEKKSIFVIFTRGLGKDFETRTFSGLFSTTVTFTVTLPHYNYITSHICGALHDLVPFVQFTKREKHPWRSVTFTLLKVTLLHGCFSHFLNYAHGTKLRNTPHLLKCNGKVASYQSCILSSVKHINYKLLIMNNWLFFHFDLLTWFHFFCNNSCSIEITERSRRFF